MDHLIKAVEDAMVSGNYYAALTVAVTLPDICGWIEDPATSSTSRYVRFFDAHMAQHYVHPMGRSGALQVFLKGKDFYALRCALLHQGTDDISLQKARATLDSFRLIMPPSNITIHCNLFGTNQLQIQVDIFCREIMKGAYAVLASIVPGSGSHTRLKSLARIHDVSGNLI